MMQSGQLSAADQVQPGSRGSFNTKLGFTLACVGSAVGMANIWLFPYRLGQFGGAAFLIPYFFFIAVIAWFGVMGEMAFGRAMGTGPLGAFKKAFERRGFKHSEFFGSIPVIGSLGIAIGYAVVVGWILRFAVGSLTGAVVSAPNSSAYFGEIAGAMGSVGWHMSALAITFAIMLLGIAKGIEKVNKVMMPAFFIMFMILAVRVFSLPGAMDGYSYLFVPKWEFLADPKTWVYALGQAFFSLSLAGSGTLVYGSYLKKSEDVVSCAKNVCSVRHYRCVAGSRCDYSGCVCFRPGCFCGAAADVYYHAKRFQDDANGAAFCSRLLHCCLVCRHQFFDEPDGSAGGSHSATVWFFPRRIHCHLLQC